MRRITLTLSFLSLLVFTGCGTIALDATDLSESAKVNGEDEKPFTVVESFEINDKAGWALGFIPANKPAGDKHNYFETMLAEQIRKAGGDAIINLKVRAQSNFGDFLISIATLGFYATRTVTVSGDVIKYK